MALQSYRTKNKGFAAPRFQDPHLIPVKGGEVLNVSAATGVIALIPIDTSCSILEFGANYVSSTSATIGTVGKYQLKLVTSASTVTAKATITTQVSKKLGNFVTATLTGFNAVPGNSLLVHKSQQGKGGAKVGTVTVYIIKRDTPPVT